MEEGVAKTAEQPRASRVSMSAWVSIIVLTRERGALRGVIPSTKGVFEVPKLLLFKEIMRTASAAMPPPMPSPLCPYGVHRPIHYQANNSHQGRTASSQIQDLRGISLFTSIGYHVGRRRRVCFEIGSRSTDSWLDHTSQKQAQQGQGGRESYKHRFGTTTAIEEAARLQFDISAIPCSSPRTAISMRWTNAESAATLERAVISDGVSRMLVLLYSDSTYDYTFAG